MREHADMHRNMEDFVTWVDTSKIKRTVMNYNDEVSGDKLSCFISYNATSLMTLTSSNLYRPVTFIYFLPSFFSLLFVHYSHQRWQGEAPEPARALVLPLEPVFQTMEIPKWLRKRFM